MSTLEIRTENGSNISSSQKTMKEPKLKSAGRKPLQVLQPSAATQTQLIGRNDSLRPEKSDIKAKKSDDVEDKLVEQKEDSTLANAVSRSEEAPSVKRKVETRSIEVQTDLSSFSGDLDNAEHIAYMTSLCGSTVQMKKIAESYSTEIFEMLAENAALKSSNAELEVDNEKLRQEKVEILEILGEAKEIIAMVEPLLEDEQEASGGETQHEASAAVEESSEPEVSDIVEFSAGSLEERK